MKEINDQHAVSLSAVITTSLSRAKLTLEELDRLIRVKLLTNVNGASRARRRAWTRNRSKIYKIQAALKEHRVNLLTALSANSLFILLPSDSILPILIRYQILQYSLRSNVDLNQSRYWPFQGDIIEP